MKWLRVWFIEDETEKIESGIVIGMSEGPYLVVRFDDGDIARLNRAAVDASTWVENPDKKVKMPKLKVRK